MLEHFYFLQVQVVEEPHSQVEPQEQVEQAHISDKIVNLIVCLISIN